MIPMPDDRPDEQLTRAIVREVIHAEAGPLIRGQIRDALSNGWAENRRLVESELARLDADHKALHKDMQRFRETVTELRTLVADLRPLRDRVTQIQVEHARAGGMWGAIAAIIVALAMKLLEVFVG